MTSPGDKAAQLGDQACETIAAALAERFLQSPQYPAAMDKFQADMEALSRETADVANEAAKKLSPFVNGVIEAIRRAGLQDGIAPAVSQYEASNEREK